jgi:hypothetical protein
MKTPIGDTNPRYVGMLAVASLPHTFSMLYDVSLVKLTIYLFFAVVVVACRKLLIS